MAYNLSLSRQSMVRRKRRMAREHSLSAWTTAAGRTCYRVAQETVVDVVAGVAADGGVVDVGGAVVDAADDAAAAGGGGGEGAVDVVVAAAAAAAAADVAQRRSWCPRTQDWLLAGTLIAIRPLPSSVLRVLGRPPA